MNANSPVIAAGVERWAVRLGWAHGLFYLVSGLWPILHMPSFLAVTGPKTDLWLVQTVGALLAVFGIGLALAARRQRLTPEWIFLAAAFPLALAIVDLVFVAREVIPPIYLADAVGELLLTALWCIIAMTRARHSRAEKTR